MTDSTCLQQQIDFLVEIDKLKQVFRRTWLRALEITDRTLLARLGERPVEKVTRIGKAR